MKLLKNWKYSCVSCKTIACTKFIAVEATQNSFWDGATIVAGINHPSQDATLYLWICLQYRKQVSDKHCHVNKNCRTMTRHRSDKRHTTAYGESWKGAGINKRAIVIGSYLFYVR